MKCERCGVYGVYDCCEIVLCEACTIDILREWKIRHAEYAELSAAQD